MTKYDEEASKLWRKSGEAELAARRAKNEGRLGDARAEREREQLYSRLALDAHRSNSWWYRTFGW